MKGSFIISLVCCNIATALCPHKSSRLLLRPSYSEQLPISVLRAKSGDDAVSRRRKRRQTQIQSPTSDSQLVNQSNEQSDSQDVKVISADKVLEDKLGLGDRQLRELLEQELPVPRENLATRKAIKDKDVDKSKVMQLPDLEEFVRVSSDRPNEGAKQGNKDEARQTRIDRSNKEEYLRVIQLNPFADADESMFIEEYDIIPSIFGSGKLVNIPIPYLQTGHSILLVISMLAALVYAPGNPLTELPLELRNFLKQSLLVVFSINTVLSVVAFQTARSKNLPGIFWAVKCFLLGGIAFYEVKQAKDPSTLK